MQETFSRRGFLSHGFAGISAAWLCAHWPAILAAANHARLAAQSSAPPRFEFFSAEQAAEIDAITARLIPTTDTPGAREAGVVYFIDRALVTFEKDNQKLYKDGLAQLRTKLHEMFPGVERFSAATPEQQDAVLHSLDVLPPDAVTGGLYAPSPQSFFETVLLDTITGFLIDPDSGGNHDGVGWKVIGRDREHMFQPPFGYYDRDYPDWPLNPLDTPKTKR
jgi:gluconate 2-dehydrogenase gamma chain